MISISATTGLPDTIRASGADPVLVLRAAGIELSAIADVEGFIPASVFAHVLDEAARATADDFFGLHFGEQFDPKDVGALAYGVLNSPTVAAAIANLVRYMRIHNRGAEISFSIKGTHAYLRYLLSEVADSRRHHNEYAMAVLCNGFRILAGSRWTPIEIQFAHSAPASVSPYSKVFGCPVTFGHPCNALVIDNSLLAMPVKDADTRLLRILEEHLDRILAEIPPNNDLVAAVRKAIAELMGQGKTGLASVAKELAMSPRTLERRLSEQGLVFKELLNDTRQRFAVDYLRHGGYRLAEIAFLIGYSEVSAFNRAFKRWTGSTPLEYRNKTTH